MTWLPRRSVRKRNSRNNSRFIFALPITACWCLGWSRCRRELFPIAADTTRLGSPTRWLGDRWLLPLTRDAPGAPRLCSLAEAIVTWLPVMFTDVVADVLCSLSCLLRGWMYRFLCFLRSWTIAVPGLAEPLDLNPFWLLVWLSGTRGSVRLLFRDFAGNRWAL